MSFIVTAIHEGDLSEETEDRIAAICDHFGTTVTRANGETLPGFRVKFFWDDNDNIVNWLEITMQTEQSANALTTELAVCGLDVSVSDENTLAKAKMRRLAAEGLVKDSGQRRWNEETECFEVLWFPTH
jgi:hypothetical protein